MNVSADFCTKQTKNQTRESPSDETLILLYLHSDGKDVIRCVFNSGIMPPNFIHFRPKIGFKDAFKEFYFTQRVHENILKEVQINTFYTQVVRKFKCHVGSCFIIYARCVTFSLDRQSILTLFFQEIVQNFFAELYVTRICLKEEEQK